MKMDGRRKVKHGGNVLCPQERLSLRRSATRRRIAVTRIAEAVVAMATQALLVLTTPSFPTSRCLTPVFRGWSCSSSVSLSNDTGGFQRRVFQVSVTAAQSESVPPPAPEADITPAAPPKPTMKKGQIVRVDKEKYLNSVEYLSVGHPHYFTGLDYIYEDRGEVLNVRNFDHGEYALIAWAGIPTSPAWLPTYMLIKADKLSYRRQ